LVGLDEPPPRPLERPPARPAGRWAPHPRFHVHDRRPGAARLERCARRAVRWPGGRGLLRRDPGAPHMAVRRSTTLGERELFAEYPFLPGAESLVADFSPSLRDLLTHPSFDRAR